MKRLVLTLALLVAFAFGEKASVVLLSREFQKGVYTIDGPQHIAAHVPTADFIVGFVNLTRRIHTNLMLEYHRQARLTGQIVGNYFEGSVEGLLRRAKEAPDGTSEFLEHSINDVIERLNKFLDARPGNFTTLDEVELSELPAAAGPVVVHYENYEPEILFNELEKLVDSDMASVYNLVQKMYLLGWKSARLSLKRMQQQFRDEFLHCTLLKTFLETTRKLNAETELVRKHVKPESWNKYKELSDRVALIAETVTLTPKFCATDVSHN